MVYCIIMITIESLNQESLKMIEQMAAKILDFATTANKELDKLEKLKELNQ